jgi:hypothetical protein
MSSALSTAVVLAFALIVVISSQSSTASDSNTRSSPRRRLKDKTRTKIKTKALHIGGIFPMSGSWAGGQGCRPAVEMALRQINDRIDLLPGYRLEMHSNDSEVW